MHIAQDMPCVRQAGGASAARNGHRGRVRGVMQRSQCLARLRKWRQRVRESGLQLLPPPTRPPPPTHPPQPRPPAPCRPPPLAPPTCPPPPTRPSSSSSVSPSSSSMSLHRVLTGIDYFMVPWPIALMHCWELLLTPHVTQTADFGHLASFS